MKQQLLVDGRWRHGGIGRFSSEVLSRIESKFDVLRVSGDWRLNDPLVPFRLASAIRKQSGDVFWSPGYIPPAHSPIPFVFTIHDLIHVHHVGGVRALYFNAIVRPLCKRAHRILTLSEFSKAEICDWAGLAPDGVVKIDNAVSGDFTPKGPRHSLGYPYLLYVGARKQHKNIPRVLRAFAFSGLAKECRLILSGAPDSQLQRLTAELGILHSVEFAGHIPDADLPSFYRGAHGVLMLTLYEGFGLPVLEAMACGTPVLCSDRTSLPEIAGEAALYADPTDIESMAEAMKRLVHDTELRSDLISEGKRRALMFSWDKTAEIVGAILHEAASSRGIA